MVCACHLQAASPDFSLPSWSLSSSSVSPVTASLACGFLLFEHIRSFGKAGPVGFSHVGSLTVGVLLAHSRCSNPNHQMNSYSSPPQAHRGRNTASGDSPPKPVLLAAKPGAVRDALGQLLRSARLSSRPTLPSPHPEQCTPWGGPRGCQLDLLSWTFFLHLLCPTETHVSRAGCAHISQLPTSPTLIIHSHSSQREGSFI